MKFGSLALACLLLAGCAGGAGGGWVAGLALAALLAGCVHDPREPSPRPAQEELPEPAAPSAGDPGPRAEPAAASDPGSPDAGFATVSAPAEPSPGHLEPAHPAPWDGVRFTPGALRADASGADQSELHLDDPHRPTSRAAIRWDKSELAETPDAREYLDRRYGPEPQTREEVRARMEQLQEVLDYPYSRMAPIYEEAELERLRQRLRRVEAQQANP